MHSQEIATEMEKVLIRYRAGLINLEQSRQELSLLVGMPGKMGTIVPKFGAGKSSPSW